MGIHGDMVCGVFLPALKGTPVVCFPPIGGKGWEQVGSNFTVTASILAAIQAPVRRGDNRRPRSQFGKLQNCGRNREGGNTFPSSIRDESGTIRERVGLARRAGKAISRLWCAGEKYAAPLPTNTAGVGRPNRVSCPQRASGGASGPRSREKVGQTPKGRPRAWKRQNLGTLFA